VQRREVVEDVQDPNALSRDSISSTSRSNVDTGFSCKVPPFRAFADRLRAAHRCRPERSAIQYPGTSRVNGEDPQWPSTFRSLIILVGEGRAEA